MSYKIIVSKLYVRVSRNKQVVSLSHATKVFFVFTRRRRSRSPLIACDKPCFVCLTDMKPVRINKLQYFRHKNDFISYAISKMRSALRSYFTCLNFYKTLSIACNPGLGKVINLLNTFLELNFLFYGCARVVQHV